MSYSDSLQARREAAAARGRGRGGGGSGPQQVTGGGMMLNFSQPAAFSASAMQQQQQQQQQQQPQRPGSGEGNKSGTNTPPPAPILGPGAIGQDRAAPQASGTFGGPMRGGMGGGRGGMGGMMMGGGPTPGFGGARGGFVNTNARLGMAQPTGPAVPPPGQGGPQPSSATAAPSAQASAQAIPQERLEAQQREQQQKENAARIQQQLQAFGVMGMIQPQQQQQGGAEPVGIDALFARDFEDDHSKDGRGVLSYVPKRGLVQCYVIRMKTSMFDKNAAGVFNHPRFILFTERGDRCICAARKRANKQTSNYLVSIDKDDLDRKSDKFFGKVRANVLGTEFVVYDNGEAPGPGIPPEKWRQEICAVVFETNVGGMKGPRKMRVLVPKLKEDGSPQVWRPATEEQSMVVEWRKNPEDPRFTVLENKAPTWNEQLRAYQLNFHGRVTSTSVKNFQLVDPKNPHRVVMQFGKNGDERFSLDFQSPLSTYQAFGIALTACDNKLSVE